MSDDDILRELAEVVSATFPDREYSGEIGPGTRFFEDLGMASIDAIVLAEQIERRYGKLPFGSFLGGLRERGATDFTLGQLVLFLKEELVR